MMPTLCFGCVLFVAWTALQPFRAAGIELCDQNCSDKPVFTPASVVVKYGDAFAATCTVCEQDCIGTDFNVEMAIGKRHKNGTTVVWTVASVTEWETSALCFYNFDAAESQQCCTTLQVTVYQPPSQVSISLVGHSGPMLDSQPYTLQCAVQNAAPIEKLQVAFFKGHTRLAVMPSNGTRGLTGPQNETFTLDFIASKEDNGAPFRCEVGLDLGISLPPVTSTDMTALVHYKPVVETLPKDDQISVWVGDPLNLTCFAEGNPPPMYNWKHPSHGPQSVNNGQYIINSTTRSDEGQYTCTASNSMGNVTLTFQVHVQTDYTVAIVAAVSVGLIILLIVTIVYLKKRRTKTYELIHQSCCKRSII